MGSKNIQLISGLNLFIYWISLYIVDILLFIIIALFGMIMVYAFDIEAFITLDRIRATWLLFFLYGISNIPLTYLLCFLFKEYGSA